MTRPIGAPVRTPGRPRRAGRSPRRGRTALVGILSVVVLLSVGGCSRPETGRSAGPGAKVLLIGLDGLEPTLVDRFVAEGRMPHLRALGDAGARLLVEAGPVLASPAIWTTIATGRSPASHGVTNWMIDGKPASSLARKQPAFWNLLPKARRKVATVCWLASWPADRDSGILITDRAWPRVTAASAEPPGVADPDRWRPMLSDAELAPDVGLAAAETTPDRVLRVDLVDKILRFARRDRFCEAAALDLLRRDAYDLFAVYLRGADISGHFFWKFFEPEAFRDLEGSVSDAEVAAGGDVIPKVYETLDAAVGRLVESAGPDVNVVVVSDHGMQAAVGRVREKPWALRSGTHRGDAVLTLAGPAIVRGGSLDRKARHEDVLPTLFRILDVPIADDLEGVVLESVLGNGVLREPARRVATYGAYRNRNQADGRDGELVEELRSLGYVQ